MHKCVFIHESINTPFHDTVFDPYTHPSSLQRKKSYYRGDKIKRNLWIRLNCDYKKIIPYIRGNLWINLDNG